MNLLTTIEHLHNQGIFSDLDVYFAQFIASFSGCADEKLLLAALLASYLTTQGHTCIDLNMQAEQIFPPLAESGTSTLRCPTLTMWLNALQNCSAVGQPGDYTPLVLDQHRLYLYRYWNYEQQLAANLRARLRQPPPEVNLAKLQEGLSRLFSATDNEEQKKAARTAVLRHFCIISGGPGTGKTFTCVKILALLLEQNPQLSIALAASTGKAAARLQDILRQVKPLLKCLPSIRAAIPQETYTVHRLLGSLPDSPHFRSHADNPLPYQVVVVDEASMIDLALMTKLAQAIPLSARWILLGDKDQLASVEAGTVLGDLCEAGHQSDLSSNSHRLLADSLVLLQKNYRFDQESGIGRLAQAVKQGQGEQALQILKSEQYPEVNWHHLRIFEALPALLTDSLMEKFATYFTTQSPEQALPQLNKFGMLSVLRQGPYGVNSINRQIEQKLSERGWLPAGYYGHYHGQPIMITRNDYTLKLFNGDLGMILRNPANQNELQAFFLSPEGQVRAFWPHRLPEHETAYAMTIHKSQGSEFEEVLILFPDQPSPLLTRELIYTAITRARCKVSVWGNEPIFKRAVAQRIRRTSGLRDALSAG
jgi:exodeoxyribonuclease V alpha subunit